MLKRKFWLLSLILIVALLAAGCGKSVDKAAEGDKKPYRIGVIFDSSGPSSSLGIPERDTVKMLEKKINDEGGIKGRPIKIYYYDSKSLESEAVLLAKRLVTQDKVSVIIGSSTSGPTLTMMKIAQDAKIPMISTAASRKIVEPVAERKWIFKTAQSDSLVVDRIMAYLKEKNLTKVAFLSMNNAYGDSGLKEFTAMASGKGVEILAKEKFDATDKDMIPQLTTIKSLNPQAVIVWAIPPSASILTQNYRQLKIEAPLIHSHGVGNKAFISMAKDDANGVLFPTGKLLVAEQMSDTDSQKQILLDYAKDYEKAFGPRSAFGGYAYDALYLAVEAINKAGDDPAAIRDELEKIENFPGVTGTFNMSPLDHNGLSGDALVWVEVVEQQWKLLGDK